MALDYFGLLETSLAVQSEKDYSFYLTTCIIYRLLSPRYIPIATLSLDFYISHYTVR